MKLATITVIHGNAPALKAVFQEIDQHADIEEISHSILVDLNH
jgi:hypothetical protein